MEPLNLKDLNFILESLEYTRLKFEDYQGYPSHEFKQQRLSDVKEVMVKVRDLIEEIKKGI